MVSPKAVEAAAKQRADGAVATKRAWEDAAPLLETVARIAGEKIDRTEAVSRLLSRDRLDFIPKFATEELTLGRVLGKGGFGTVSEVRAIRCEDGGGGGGGGGPDASSDDGDDGFLDDRKHQDRRFIADHCLRDSGDSRYCIKALSPEVIADKQLLTQGVIDMCVETMFLSVIKHPHIITMRAFGTHGMLRPHYFIVLDRLYDTLEARIPKWRLRARKAKSMCAMIIGTSSGKAEELMETKLCYAYDLMGAFEYLHKRKLVYRDLKPENVGFNIRDDIVLFDFGLVREVQDEEKVSDKTWKLTGETGSLRYMAPEVASNKPYGYSADMFSFGIMLWEMLEMQKPFAGMSRKAHSELIVKQGGRPKVNKSWGASLAAFLKSCWHQDLTQRPTAPEASAILRREVGDGSGVDLDNMKRKSTHVNRNALRERFDQ